MFLKNALIFKFDGEYMNVCSVKFQLYSAPPHFSLCSLKTESNYKD